MDYVLFADANSNEPVLKGGAARDQKGPGYSRSAPPKWSVGIPVRGKAMVKAGDKLYVAGPPKIAPGQDSWVALEGKKGSRLCVFSTADGTKLEEYKLDDVPVFDGMIAAYGRVYMATQAGRLLCLAK